MRHDKNFKNDAEEIGQDDLISNNSAIDDLWCFLYIILKLDVPHNDQ